MSIGEYQSKFMRPRIDGHIALGNFHEGVRDRETLLTVIAILDCEIYRLEIDRGDNISRGKIERLHEELCELVSEARQQELPEHVEIAYAGARDKVQEILEATE